MIINYISKPGGGEPIPAPAVHEELIYTSLGTTTVKDGITYNNVKLTGINYSGSTKTEISIPETFEDGGVNYYISQINNDFLVATGSSVGVLTKIWIMGSEYSWVRNNNNEVQMIPSTIKEMLFYAAPINNAYSSSGNDMANYPAFYGSTLERLTFVGALTQLCGKALFKGANIPEVDYADLNPFRTLTTMYGNNCFESAIQLSSAQFASLINLSGGNGGGYGSGVFKNSPIVNATFPALKYLTECTGSYDSFTGGHFANCTNMTYFEAPLASIPRQTFKGSSHLTTIRLTGNTVPTITFGTGDGWSPFNGCSSLAHIYVKAALVNDVKTLFANAGYSNYGSNLESIVEADPDE